MDMSMSMVAGDTIAFGVELWALEDGQEVPMTQDLDNAYFTCRTSPTQQIIFQKTIGNGIDRVAENNYTYRVHTAPEDTANVAKGQYEYDFVIELNNDRYTFLHGVLDIQSNVTPI